MTIAIILSAHGSVSKKLLYTTEMIIGKQQNVVWVDLLPTENTDILIEKYSINLSKLNIDMGVLFLVDIWGGTPFNAAQKIILNKKNYDIVTGINIPMLIEVFMERDKISSIKELVHIALKSGSESIKSVKYPLHHNTYSNQTTNKAVIHNTPPDSDVFNGEIAQKHMTICLARIDDRLIHGQVVTRWAKAYDINRIIVVNDDVAKDEIRKKILTQVTPPGITAHIVDIGKAIRVYNNPKYSKDKVILLFTNPTDVLRIIEGGISITSVNIGGMSFYQGKKQITNTISINSIDIEAFTKLNELGVNLEVRQVPSDSSLKLMTFIKDLTK